jgi:hypothetical protein
MTMNAKPEAAALKIGRAVTALMLMLSVSQSVEASGSRSGSHRSGTKTTAATKSSTPKKAPIERSAKAKHDFEKETGYPLGRPGYVVDHIVPLACGGADAPSNMQWQTVAAAKAKDRVELNGCRK